MILTLTDVKLKEVKKKKKESSFLKMSSPWKENSKRNIESSHEAA